MSFDLGAEVFILPVLWGATLLTSLGAVASSFKRIVVEVADEDGGFDITKWVVNKARLVKTGAFAGAMALLLSSMVVVPPGSRGVIYSANGGVSEVERPEGVSFVTPVFQNAIMVNVREQKYENLEVYAQTKDLLEVTIQIGVNYFIQPDRAAEIVAKVGNDYQLTIIEPAVLDIVKQEAGQVEAIDFPRNREAIASAILDALNERLGTTGIQATFVAIQDTIFNAAYVNAVLAKESADEKAAESEKLVEVAKNEAAQAVARAQGESDAIAAIAQSLGFTPTQYLEYLRLTVWDGILPTTILGGDADVIVGLP